MFERGLYKVSNIAGRLIGTVKVTSSSELICFVYCREADMYIGSHQPRSVALQFLKQLDSNPTCTIKFEPSTETGEKE